MAHKKCCLKNPKELDNWHIAGAGETLEKNWECKKCKKSWREVYIYSCEIDNETEKEL